MASIGQPVSSQQEMGITESPVTKLDGSGFTPTVVDSYDFGNDAPVSSSPVRRTAPLYGDPLTIESVLNSFAGKKKSKLGMQIYFTPTVSYRKLTENSDYLRSPAPLNNSLITPDIETEQWIRTIIDAPLKRGGKQTPVVQNSEKGDVANGDNQEQAPDSAATDNAEG